MLINVKHEIDYDNWSHYITHSRDIQDCLFNSLITDPLPCYFRPYVFPAVYINYLYRSRLLINIYTMQMSAGTFCGRVKQNCRTDAFYRVGHVKLFCRRFSRNKIHFGTAVESHTESTPYFPIGKQLNTMLHEFLQLHRKRVDNFLKPTWFSLKKILV